MMLECKTFGEAYGNLVRVVRGLGAQVDPRGKPTLEVIGTQVFVSKPGEDVLATGWNRKLNTRIAMIEGLSLISGFQYPKTLTDISPAMMNFTDGDVWFHGAYGPRLRYQLEDIALNRFKRDPDTRQAVATIWDPAYDGHGDVRDTPCTTQLQFLLRDDKLHMVTTMRSNDVWRGFPYDVFQFTLLQQAMAAHLEVEVGHYYHNATSLHIYESDIDASKDLFPIRDEKAKPFSLKLPDLPWRAMRVWAHEVILNDPFATYPGPEYDAWTAKLHRK